MPKLDLYDNKALDAAVVDVIKSGGGAPVRAGAIADRIADASGTPRNLTMRPLDRSLQRCKKSREITLVTGPGGGWIHSPGGWVGGV